MRARRRQRGSDRWRLRWQLLGPMADNGSLFSAISVGMPARRPLSTSAFLTHSFRVCGVQPIFDAIDITACQRDGCWASVSRTSRTARSRTSGENLFVVLLMVLHPTQELEPPANPARFSRDLLWRCARRRTWGLGSWLRRGCGCGMRSIASRTRGPSGAWRAGFRCAPERLGNPPSTVDRSCGSG